MTTAAIFALFVRYGIVVLFFPFHDKLLAFEQAVSQAQQVFTTRSIAKSMIIMGLAIEILCSIGVVTGFADRASAFLIAGYCAATAVLFKFYLSNNIFVGIGHCSPGAILDQGDFWAEPDGKGRTLFWDFLKNLSLGAGILLIVVGTDGSALTPFLAHPLASSHPYGVHP